MRRYKVVFGESPMHTENVYVNANNPYKAQTIVMDKFNVSRHMIYMTAWVDNKEVA
tara:strand:- start:3670 stop:3837 length:168 start_codon:yes stop_codon:yes gene_type:complete